MRKVEYSECKNFIGRPARVVWAVAEHDGKRSICPLGWKMTTSNSPPMIAISVAPTRFTHDLILNSGGFVLAWPGEDLAEATFFCGTNSGKDVDKFEAMNLSPLKAKHVEAPLIRECIANLECRLSGQLTTGDHTIFAGEVLSAYINEIPKRLLCLVNHSSGYDFILEKRGYRFGVAKR